MIVAGGDGTLNEAVNGIFLQKTCSPEELPLAWFRLEPAMTG